MKTPKLQGPWSYEAVAKAVLSHAITNYEKGWDEIVECMGESEIVEELRSRKIWSLGGAIRFFQFEVSLRQEARLNTEAHLHNYS